jgi:hypothetical protein
MLLFHRCSWPTLTTAYTVVNTTRDTAEAAATNTTTKHNKQSQQTSEGRELDVKTRSVNTFLFKEKIKLTQYTRKEPMELNTTNTAPRPSFNNSSKNDRNRSLYRCIANACVVLSRSTTTILTIATTIIAV